MLLRRLIPGLLALSYLAGLAGCDAGASGDDSTAAPAQLLGCTVATPPATAPGGYYTNGTTVCTAAGAAHLFHGVDRPSLEWDPAGNLISAADFRAMAAWHANVVRIALNQDFWLSGAALYNAAYAGTVDQAVKNAEAAGLDVILDLHWSDQGHLGVTDHGTGQDKATDSDQQPMADVNSKQFWTEVATKYKDDGHVLFELYNEPHGISWQLWLNGGMTTYQIVGMQDLYNAVRATGANNVVIAGGLSYAFDLSGVGPAPIIGTNIMYATHPYSPQNPKARWETSFGYLATRDIAPVIATEFGDTASTCTGAWNTDLIQFNDAHHISWTGWAWFVANACSFPSLIADWSGTPTVQGAPVKAALLGYVYQPGGKPELGTAGAGGSGGAGTAGTGGAGGKAGATSTGGTAGASTAGAAGTSAGGTGSAAGGSAGSGGGGGTSGAATGGVGGAATGGTGGAAGSAGTAGVLPT